LSIGVKSPKGKGKTPDDEEIAKTIKSLENKLDIKLGSISIVGGVAEINLSKIIGSVNLSEKYPDDFWNTNVGDIGYGTISPYPFAVRDVAVFVPNSVEQSSVEELIKNELTSIVVRFSMFDKFTKEDRTSYAFRLIFQAQDKTLKDAEINSVMDRIYAVLKAQPSFEIR